MTSLPFFPIQFLPPPSSQSHPLFLIIIGTHTHKHIHNREKKHTKYNLVLLVMYTCLDMITLIWITYQGDCPWRKLILPTPAAIGCSSSSRDGVLGNLSLSAWPCQLVWSLVEFV